MLFSGMSELRFHWCLPPSHDPALYDTAQSCGFESVLAEALLDSPSEIENALRLAEEFPNLRLMIPFRSGAVSREELVRWDSRKIVWNAVCARLPHMPRNGPAVYANADWYPASRKFLKDIEPGAEIHVYGNTSEAAFLAIQHATCLWRFAAPPEDVYSHAAPVLHFGKEAGLVASVLARATKGEALQELASIRVEWLTPWLGRSPEWPLNAPVLAGSYLEIANALVAWKRMGISQFLFAAADDQCEMEHFSSGVLPLVRSMEAAIA